MRIENRKGNNFNKQEAFLLYCTAVKELNAVTKEDYFKKNKNNKYPSPDFFLQNFQIKFTDVQKKMNREPFRFKDKFPDKESIFKLSREFFVEEEQITKNGLNKWYGRQISEYISRMFGSWSKFKNELKKNGIDF